jgi:hypothetical protein
MKHLDQTLALLRKQIKNDNEVAEIRETAMKVSREWVDPLSGGKEQTNGLIYGLVQSGKTGVLTATGAIAADEGYRALIILTSDNEPLYEQTLSRAREAFPGMDIIGKREFKDDDAFVDRIKSGTCAIITTKNSRILKTLIENFTGRRLKGLSSLIIDDEADQASLNTKARKADGSRSAINERIAELRGFFDKSTYLQVTATPQALFLQTPGHDFRPKFTVLSFPGADYVGGDDFFGDESTLVTEFDIHDLDLLSPGPQPNPRMELPRSLVRALDTFLVAATYKRMRDVDDNCAFLCHVSTKTSDHNHIVNLLRAYKNDLTAGLNGKDKKLFARLRNAFADLSNTDQGLRRSSFDEIVATIEFFSRGITVKLVNGQTDEDVAVESPYNLFVGGNKLGRGVTIRNLLVSYYGRNPRTPQADTVLQHARMYGYRRRDIGLLRLFLPEELHQVYRAINEMEKGLRALIARHPTEEFRGIYVESGINPTRRNVLAPGAIGIYSGGSSYNPAQIERTPAIEKFTSLIDAKVIAMGDKTFARVPLTVIVEILDLVRPSPKDAERIWNPIAISESVEHFEKISQHTHGYLYVDRDRDLVASRHETRGILTGGEAGKVPPDLVTLFLLRTTAAGGQAAWWPQIRFPEGGYGFAFAL